MVNKIGLDLGYANITLSDMTCGVFREPAVALIDKNSRRIISVGTKAIEESDAYLESALLVRPFKNGLLFDKQITQSIIANATKNLVNEDKLRLVVGIPSDLSQRQERELYEMFVNVGIKDCLFVNRSVAALVGAGCSPKLSVISVNVGAAFTEIVVFDEGKITVTQRAPVGGEDFDKAVKQYIFDQGDVNVSGSVARDIKEKLGSVWRGKPSDSVQIEGTLAMTGNKISMTISTDDIVGVFEKPLYKLLMAVAEVVKKIPLDNVEKTFKNGIVLTGGGAMIHGMDVMMEKIIGVPVYQPSGSIDSVAKGLSLINSMMPYRGRAGGKNVTDFVAKYYQENLN